MTTVPFKATEMLAYVNGVRPQSIDLACSPLSPEHVWNYLAFLKTTDRVVGVSAEQLAEYMTTRNFVRNEGVIEIVKCALAWHVDSQQLRQYECDWDWRQVAEFVECHQDIMDAYIQVLTSLPVFLRTKAGAYSPTAEQYVDSPDTVGVNFCHLFADPTFLFELLPSVFAVDVTTSPYYTDLFEDYIYGGDNLVWFVTSNPDNLLFQSFAS